MRKKIYVDVTAEFTSEGLILPKEIKWKDGIKFEIDKVTDIRPCASLKAGGAGIRYTCLIKGRPAYIFMEENRWFVEAKS